MLSDELETMLAGLARQKIGASEAVDDAADYGQRDRRIGARLLQISGELGTQMADQPPGKGTGQGGRSGFRVHLFLPVFADGVGGERAGGIEKNIVQPGVARCAKARGKRFMRGKREVQLEESGVAGHGGRELAGERGQLRGCSEHDCLIAGFVVSGVQRLLAGLRDNLRATIQKAHDRRYVKDVLVESAIKEDAVAVQRTAQGESELLLLRVRFEIEVGLGRAECAVSNEIKIGPVELIRSGFRDHIYNRAAGSSQVCAVGI